MLKELSESLVNTEWFESVVEARLKEEFKALSSLVTVKNNALSLWVATDHIDTVETIINLEAAIMQEADSSHENAAFLRRKLLSIVDKIDEIN